MSAFEVEQPILNSPFAEPAEHWLIEEGQAPKRVPGRRRAGYFYRDPRAPQPEPGEPVRGAWQELELVNLICERLAQWRDAGYPGATRTTLELIRYWRRDGHPACHQVELRGLDTFDPATFDAEHRDGSDVPACLLDTAWNGMSFHVSQAFFPRTSAWESLKKALKTEFEESVWDHLSRTVSAQFTEADSREIAVKVIDDRGNELLVVRSLDEVA